MAAPPPVSTRDEIGRSKLSRISYQGEFIQYILIKKYCHLTYRHFQVHNTAACLRPEEGHQISENNDLHTS